MELPWGGGVEGVVFEDYEGVFGCFQADGAGEGGVGEGVDYGRLGGRGVFPLVGVDVEAEGGVLVLWPEVLGAVADGGVQGGVVGSRAPEFVDGGAED